MKRAAGKRALPLIILLALSLFLGGCAAIPTRQEAAGTLPPVALPYQAPLGDTGENLAQTVLLCLPSAQSGMLEYFQEKVLIPPNKHPAEYALRRLFTFPGTTAASPLSPDAQLSLNSGSPIEISGDAATVNLAPSALALDNQGRYRVFRAIANTLTQWGDIRYVNVLINNRAQGLDTAATMPMGSLSRTEDGDIAALWESVNRTGSSRNSSHAVNATIFYPVTAGRGIQSEGRYLVAENKSPEQLVLALLSAMSQAPASLPNSVQAPDLTTLLSGQPEMEEAAGSLGRVVSLRFQESMNQELINLGIPRSIMMASLTCTLTTFLPYTSGVKVTIGNELVTALVPSGLYEGAGEEILFDGGVMRRAQFSRFLLDDCALFFANAEGGLSLAYRPIPHYQTQNPRYLLNQLMLGPQGTDSRQSLSPVLPETLRDADILGATMGEDTALINFSGNLNTLSQGMDGQGELRMVYAMVNTLTAIKGIKQACFFVDGRQEGTFAGNIDIAGVFLENVGIAK